MEAKKRESISNLLSPSPLGRPDTQAIMVKGVAGSVWSPQKLCVFFRYTKLLKSNHYQHCYAKYEVFKVSSNERKEVVISNVVNKVSFK